MRFIRVYISKPFVAITIGLMLFQILLPLKGFSITSGPPQPEFQSFEPASANNMVNVETGDFTYNIPLFEVPGPNGGYPLNLAYQSGVTMDQEASWVGLGWTLNTGAINRNVRGIPDDFCGDKISYNNDMKKNFTVSVTGGANLEITSFGIGLNATTSFNNYRGLDFKYGMSLSGSYQSSSGVSAGLGLDLSVGSEEGAGLGINMSLGYKNGRNSCNFSGGIGINSLKGLTDISLNASVSKSATTGKEVNDDRGKLAGGGSASLGYSSSFASSLPSMSIAHETTGKSLAVNFQFGFKPAMLLDINGQIAGFYSDQVIKTKNVDAEAYGYYNMEKANNRDDVVLDFNREKDGALRKESSNAAIPVIGFDNYTINGQGYGGSFRAYRSDVGKLYDRRMYSESYSIKGGLDVDAGPLYPGVSIKIGANAGGSGFVSSIGKWEIGEYLKFFDAENLPSGVSLPEDYQPASFKFMGESSIVPTAFYNGWKGEDPIRFDLDPIKPMADSHKAVEQMTQGGEITTPLLSFTHRQEDGREVGPEGLDADFFLKPKYNSYLSNEPSSREPQSSVILPLKNNELADLPEYGASYYSQSNINQYLAYGPTTLNRNYSDSYKPNHIGAFVATTTEGIRYVYSLPVYNTINKEVLFSCDKAHYDQSASLPQDQTVPLSQATEPLVAYPSKNGLVYNHNLETTEEFNSCKALPAYTTSHLLTAILGNDYIDVNRNGPDDQDLGYWVKFTYLKASENYKWRAPFVGVNYDPGNESAPLLKDSKGSYLYGEKQLYYLATVETKTHKAVFELGTGIDARHDGLGAYAENQNEKQPLNSTTQPQEKSYLLSEIKLFPKDDAGGIINENQPLTTVFFKYNYKLCRNVENSDATSDENGKLSLEEVYFKYESSNAKSGSYKFKYNGEDDLTHRYDYNRFSVDRWGCFKDYPEYNPTESGLNHNDKYVFNYVDQFDANLYPDRKQQLDNDISAWNLSEITTPSGNKIGIEYESDDYGYVQNRVAGQMFRIKSFGFAEDAGKIYDGLFHKASDANQDEMLKIHFDLETPTASSNDLAAYFKDLPKDNDGNYTLYYKVRLKLRKEGDKSSEFVSGYLRFKENSWGFAGVTNSENKYTSAFVKVEPSKPKNKEFHPLAMAGWQFIKSNRPELIASDPQQFAVSCNTKDEIKKVSKQILGTFSQVQDLFLGFYSSSETKGFCKRAELITLGAEQYVNGWIRLSTPDKIKFGGGLRVKKVVMKGNWFENNSSSTESDEFGVVYEYTTEEKDMAGNAITISSGVAQYEPLLGGDENCLHHPRFYSENIPLNSDLNFYFEYPINESYYPAPIIVYSKVSVTSLATYKQLKTIKQNLPTTNSDFMSGNVPLTGQTVYEYYTAKDFPVITDETQMNPDHYSKPPAIPPFPSPMSCSMEFLKVSQGYCIQLNDMHGKQKAITYFGQDKDGNLINVPVSKVEYKYLSKPKVVNGILSNELVNEVETMTKDDIATQSRLMGLHEELFVDTRLSQDYTFSGGVDINAEVDIWTYVPVVVMVPIPIPIPTINASYGEVRSIVSNKLITRAGVLSEIIATDGTSTISTKNEVYDAITGQPVLTSVNNNFNAPIYDYKIPAHWAYKQMGPAYQNLEKEYREVTLTPVSGSDHYDFTVSNSDAPMLIKGDELLVSIGSHKNLKAIVSDIGAVIKTIHLVGDFGSAVSGNCTLKVIRSGNRNLLSATAAEYKTLELNPVTNRTTVACVPVAYVPLDGNACELINNSNVNTDIETLINKIWSNPGFVTNIQTNFNSSFTLSANEYSSTISLPSSGAVALNSLSQFFDEITVKFIVDFEPAGEHPSCNNECPLNKVRLEFHPLCGSCENSVIEFYSMSKTFTVEKPPYPSLWQGKNYLKYKNPECGEHCFADLMGIMGWETGEILYFPIDLIGCHTLTATSCTIENLSLKVIDNVLAASATSYEDFWPQDFHSLNFQQRSDLLVFKGNKYLDGELGIWRPRQNFAYLDERKQTTRVGSSIPDVKLMADGTFDNVPLFQHNNSTFLNCSLCQKWKPASTVTKYSPYNYEIENKDVLGIYSSTLYAYNGKLNTAVAGNAREEEIGFTSFEDYASNDDNYYTSFSDNLCFPNKLHSNATVSNPVVKNYEEEFDILRGTGNQILIRKNFNGSDNFTAATVLAEKPSTGETVVLDATVTQAEENGFTLLTLSGTGPDFPTGAGTPLQCYGGRLFIKRLYEINITDNNSFIVEGDAHSGKRALKILANTVFNQGDLRLIAGKKYLISCWVKGDNLKPEAMLTDFSNVPSIQVTAQGSNYSIYPKGEVIEGWQKFEGSFDVPNTFVPGNLSMEFKPGDQSYLLIDDIRLLPSESNMKTFVYNPDNFKLCSVLDDNNYGTFYYYNEKGNLFLVKRETPKGKMTVGETRSYMKTTQQ